MGLTYEWAMRGLKKQNSGSLNDIIIGTQWQVVGTNEDGVTGQFTVATPFKLSELDPSKFTSFDDLTQEQVLSWIKNVVSGSNPATNYWDHISERINDEIFKTKHSVVEILSHELPWSTGSIADSDIVGPK